MIDTPFHPPADFLSAGLSNRSRGCPRCSSDLIGERLPSLPPASWPQTCARRQSAHSHPPSTLLAPRRTTAPSAHSTSRARRPPPFHAGASVRDASCRSAATSRQDELHASVTAGGRGLGEFAFPFAGRELLLSFLFPIFFCFFSLFFGGGGGGGGGCLAGKGTVLLDTKCF